MKNKSSGRRSRVFLGLIGRWIQVLGSKSRALWRIKHPVGITKSTEWCRVTPGPCGLKSMSFLLPKQGKRWGKTSTDATAGRSSGTPSKLPTLRPHPLGSSALAKSRSSPPNHVVALLSLALHLRKLPPKEQRKDHSCSTSETISDYQWLSY